MLVPIWLLPLVAALPAWAGVDDNGPASLDKASDRPTINIEHFLVTGGVHLTRLLMTNRRPYITRYWPEQISRKNHPRVTSKSFSVWKLCPAGPQLIARQVPTKSFISAERNSGLHLKKPLGTTSTSLVGNPWRAERWKRIASPKFLARWMD